MRKASLLSVLLVIYSQAILAQTADPEMADTMRSNGKIYVVVLVLATIFAGIIALLIRLDRRITKFEKSKQS